MKHLFAFIFLLLSLHALSQVEGFISVNGHFGLSGLSKTEFDSDIDSYYPIVFYDGTKSAIQSGGIQLSGGVRLLDRFSISMGFSIMRRGMQTDFGYNTSPYSYYYGRDIKLTLDYYAIPVITQVHFLSKRNLTLNVGIIPGRLDSAVFQGDMTFAHELTPVGDWGYDEVSEYDWTSRLNPKSLIGLLGIEYEFIISEYVSIPLGVSYQFDFKKLGIWSRNREFEISDLKNWGYYFNLGLKFSFGKQNSLSETH
mgnify:CR=1 FL=1